MSTWEGHKSVTRTVLLGVLTRATTESATPPEVDRVLFTACEFWAAARTFTLLGHINDNSVSRLRAAEAAFRAMGVPKTADVLRQGSMALTERDSRALLQVAEDIERALDEIDEPVDLVIADFARHHFINKSSS